MLPRSPEAWPSRRVLCPWCTAMSRQAKSGHQGPVMFRTEYCLGSRHLARPSAPGLWLCRNYEACSYHYSGRSIQGAMESRLLAGLYMPVVASARPHCMLELPVGIAMKALPFHMQVAGNVELPAPAAQYQWQRDDAQRLSVGQGAFRLHLDQCNVVLNL